MPQRIPNGSDGVDHEPARTVKIRSKPVVVCDRSSRSERYIASTVEVQYSEMRLNSIAHEIVFGG